jgi:hypothetical protein
MVRRSLPIAGASNASLLSNDRSMRMMDDKFRSSTVRFHSFLMRRQGKLVPRWQLYQVKHYGDLHVIDVHDKVLHRTCRRRSWFSVRPLGRPS